MRSFPSIRGDVYLGEYGEGLDHVIRALDPSDILWVADTLTARYCMPLLRSIAEDQPLCVIPAGEVHKNLESCTTVWSRLAEMKADRGTLLINVGGGMICDLGGFAAACYQRGIRFAHIPTSLLAMVDAAIGGKTGVDFKGYKNYLGRIEVPAFVWTDPLFLRTLPEVEYRNGLTEIVKHAIVASPALWQLLETADLDDPSVRMTMLEENIRIKQQVVEEDPYEHSRRKILNFGHTIGHALESYFLDSATPLSHGAAVTLGMMAESRMAVLMGLLSHNDFERIIPLTGRLLRPAEVPLPTMAELTRWLEGDKKNKGGVNRYSLPTGIGACQWHVAVEENIVYDAMRWLVMQGLHPDHRLNTV